MGASCVLVEVTKVLLIKGIWTLETFDQFCETADMSVLEGSLRVYGATILREVKSYRHSFSGLQVLTGTLTVPRIRVIRRNLGTIPSHNMPWMPWISNDVNVAQSVEASPLKGSLLSLVSFSFEHEGPTTDKVSSLSVAAAGPSCLSTWSPASAVGLGVSR